MIHVLNFNSQIIDFISQDDNAVTLAKYHKNKDNDLLDIRISSQRAEHLKKRNRIIIQDKNGVYREYIIDRAEEDGRYVDVECTASHLVDISTSKPIPPGKYEKMTINQKLSETLRDSGWVVGDCDYAGIKTNSWTSVRTPLEMISQLETAHEVQADYEIEIDGYEVVERRVNMRTPVPLFKGKEIEYGKDLLSMKRVIDFSEVKTALYAFGPEPEEGNRIETIVYDDEAQEQFDLPYRYIWDAYEPETDDTEMTLERLKTLTRTELNKRKSAAVSYEISVADIEKEFPHEVIRYGDIVRIKNPDFTPPLYAESEVVGIEHDLISNKCTYEFGKVVEYQEDDLLRYFKSKLGYFNQKLNDNFSNVNTIVQQTIDGELKHFERKILKGDTPPDNPVNDVLWLDTTNPENAVLRRYWNGEWISRTAEKASDIGAVTREQSMYYDLKNTFINLNIQHSRLLKEVSEIVESEYFVDADLKKEVNDKLNATVDVFNHIKTNLDSMNEETATIGKLVDTQALFLNYRSKMQELYNSLENAKIAIDERFKLLQSQYTDEKFNDAMSKVAEALPNGNWNAETGQLTSDIPNEERLFEIQQQLNTALNRNIANISTSLQNYTDSQVKQAKDELSSSVVSVKEDVQDKIDSVSINVAEAKNSIKILQNSLLLTATKSDVKRILDENLETLKNDVSEQKAQLQIMSDSINSKVSQSDYITDKNNIVERLNMAETERQQLSDSISDKVSLSEYNSGIEASKHYADERINNLEIGNVNLIRSYNYPGYLKTATVEDDYSLLFSTSGKNINFFFYNRDDNINPPLEPNTDYILQLYEADENVEMGVFFNQGRNTVKTYTKDRIIRFNTGSRTDFRIILISRDANQRVGKVSLYKGTKELDWTPNPEDVEKSIIDAEVSSKAYADAQDELRKKEIEAYADGIVTAEEQRAIADAQAKLEQAKKDATAKSNNAEQLAKQYANTVSTNAEANAKAYADSLKREQDKVLTKYNTRIDQNGKDIEQRATKEEFNASKQLLDKTIAQIITSAISGISLTYNQNGTISDLVLNDEGVFINSQLINMNQGDVVIENGRTTIKNLNADKVKVAYNGINDSINIVPEGLETRSDGKRTSLLDGHGHHFYHNNKYVGFIGTTEMITPDNRGLNMNLTDIGQYLAFSYRNSDQESYEPNNVAMLWSKGVGGYPRGFCFNEDIIVSDKRVIETSYLRPFKAPTQHRLFLSGRQTGDEVGTAIQYNNKDSTALFFSQKSIKIIGYDSKTNSMVGFNVFSNYITSEMIYNRTYSSAGNVFITQYGTLGRSTSASKYKLSQERQFNDDEKQYNHSKRILDLDIKTWFDKFEAETYAEEILTGEKKEDEDFKIKRYTGLIAEDVEAVGLNEFVTRGKDDEIEGIEYDRLWIHLIPIIKKQSKEIEELKSEMLKNGK